MLRKSRILIVAASVASAAIAPAVVPSTAQAASSCYGSTCTGLVAANTTCVNDAEIIYSVNIMSGITAVGNIQLKYSPSCRATWARVESYYSFGDYADIQSNTDSGLAMQCYGGDTAYTGCNTDMIDDANMTSYAIGGVSLSGVERTATTGSY